MLNSMKSLGMTFLNSFTVTLQRRLPNSAAYMERQKMAVRRFLFSLSGTPPLIKQLCPSVVSQRQ
jgi:hypothetical protein